MIGTAGKIGIVSFAGIVLGACVGSFAGQFPSHAETLKMCAAIIVTGGLTALGAALLPILDLLSSSVGNR